MGVETREIRLVINDKVKKAADIAARARRSDIKSGKSEKARIIYWKDALDKVGIKATDEVRSAMGHLWSMRSHSFRRKQVAQQLEPPQVSQEDLQKVRHKPPRQSTGYLFPGPQYAFWNR